jgi:hypothetical protein
MMDARTFEVGEILMPRSTKFWNEVWLDILKNIPHFVRSFPVVECKITTWWLFESFIELMVWWDNQSISGGNTHVQFGTFMIYHKRTYIMYEYEYCLVSTIANIAPVRNVEAVP